MRHQQVNNFGRSSKTETSQTLNCSLTIPWWLKKTKKNPEFSFSCIYIYSERLWNRYKFDVLKLRFVLIEMSLPEDKCDPVWCSVSCTHLRKILNIQFSGKICCLPSKQVHLTTNYNIRWGSFFFLVCSMWTSHEETISSVKHSFVAQRHWWSHNKNKISCKYTQTWPPLLVYTVFLEHEKLIQLSWSEASKHWAKFSQTHI